MDEVCSWQIESLPNPRNQNLVVSSDDKINSCKQDCDKLTTSTQRTRTSLNLEYSQIAQAIVHNTEDNSERCLQENANLFVGVSERRRRSRISTKERTRLLRNGKTETATPAAGLDTYKIQGLNYESRRENPIDGISDPKTVERYISLDSRSLDAPASEFRVEEPTLKSVTGFYLGRHYVHRLLSR